MIQTSKAKNLESLIYGVLQNFFQNPVSGATSILNPINSDLKQPLNFLGVIFDAIRCKKISTILNLRDKFVTQCRINFQRRKFFIKPKLVLFFKV